jgi:hypothetical protein
MAIIIRMGMSKFKNESLFRKKNYLDMPMDEVAGHHVIM